MHGILEYNMHVIVYIYIRVERKKKLLNLDIAVVSNDVTGPNKHANVI